MPAEQQRDPLVEFAMRWWWLLAIGVILGIIGAIAYSRVGPTTYSSTALIQVPAQTGGTDPTANAERARSATLNYAAEGSSTRMYQLVGEELSRQSNVSAVELLEMENAGTLSVGAQRNANFIAVTVINEDPELAKLIADTFSTVFVADVNQRAEAQSQARRDELQRQIDFTRQQLAAAQLFNRRDTLEQDIRNYRNTLLSLQTSYQNSLAQRVGDGEASEAQEKFDQAISAQIQDIEQTIDIITGDLDSVNTEIANLPADTDPLVSSAYAVAYTTQLTALTGQYVQEQLATLTSSPAMIQYGDASNPLSTASLKKSLFLGVALGGALAAGLGFGIDLLRSRRTSRRQRTTTVPAENNVNEVLEAIERLRSRQAIGISRPVHATSRNFSETD